MAAVINYGELEHIDTAYRSSLDALPGQIGFANFAGTRNGDGVKFMVTLFFNVDTPLNTTHTEYPTPVGNNEFSMYTQGTFGLYVFNMDSSQQEQTRHLTGAIGTGAPLIGLGVTGLSFTEVDQSADPTQLIEDNIQAYVGPQTNFFYWDDNGLQPGVDLTGLLETNGTGNTLLQAGFPFTANPGTNAGFYFTSSGSAFGPNGIMSDGPLHSVGVIPEPSAAILIGAVFLPGLLLRRRRSA